ncbi:MAG: NupC/NupG family nucleoside CNT transporter [Gammaproteobacteria bacterium]|jgi:CNT family concentrative nucleoside transporter|nr:NupC/NupG family nucleoside CNT transporter [Gammaproteobacteria bacterium]MBT3868238.1 NupC/NupG family nucleoside CNT transporter [Gammaproteobacteria bacterium]MBT4381001.1 NupC/NupG family nucleoside CNT transporter [Gammaproteobacteria bacterium]MBT4619113.1 NupC/NupG family nucleoside CNT transporter [Gammaproteobacteria bacterium]MBT5198848.1 NupC/NupG family nucleoside CNT transporter [Gammaproteobacteria bacterium]
MLVVGQSLLGMLFIILTGYLLSSQRSKINWRTVLGAFGIQLAIGALVLYFPPGMQALEAVAGVVISVLGYAQAGIDFMFGDFASGNHGFVFALQVLPVIVFFASLIAVLYHLGIMERLVRLIGGFIQFVLGTSKAESMSAATNIFIGQSEAPIAIKPYLSSMSSSEIFAVMVGGMATVSGSVLGGYAAAGVDMRYLIAASFMAAPAGLMMAKLIKPESSDISSDDSDVHEDILAHRAANVIDAAATGALQGMQLAFAIGALLLAFIGLIALINGMIGWGGSFFGIENLTMQQILGYLFQPVAFLIGVPWEETRQVGSLLGQKFMLNEFIAYLDFVANYQSELTPRTQAIVTFALCGFACLSSIAIVVGGIGILVPQRRAELSQLGLLAVVAATLANLMSATIAGLILTLS